MIGRLPVVQFPDLGVTLARGGLGKVQFAVQTQHLLDTCSDWDLIVCAGAAGALAGQSVCWRCCCGNDNGGTRLQQQI